jgi:hypothetical protein
MRSKQEGLSAKTKWSKGTRTSVGVFVALVLLCAAVAASVALPRNSSQASPKKYKATKEIVLDKTTGRLRKPTQEETDAMVSRISVLTNRSSEGLTVNQRSNGMKSVDLQGRLNSVVLGRANADGTTEIRCVFSIEEAADFLGLEEE